MMTPPHRQVTGRLFLDFLSGDTNRISEMCEGNRKLNKRADQWRGDAGESGL
jgi:hypothetical protein